MGKKKKGWGEKERKKGKGVRERWKKEREIKRILGNNYCIFYKDGVEDILSYII